MKQQLLRFCLGLLTVFAASAVQASCFYRDHFQVSNESPASLQVMELTEITDGISYQPLDYRSFELSAVANWHCGVGSSRDYAIVKIGVDEYNYCSLRIYDMPWMNHPSVVPVCMGSLHYTKMTYLGTFTHRYDLHFVEE